MKPRESHIFDKAKDGWYVEPAWVIERLLAVERFPGVIWDPACGGGTIVKAARQLKFHAIGSDLIKRGAYEKRDFLQHGGKWKGKFSIVCNPPFDHIEEFARHAVELGARKVAMIMLVRRLNAAHWLRDLPLRRVWLLTPRPSMPPGEWIAKGNKPGGGTQDFCWVIFERGYAGFPDLRWLNRDERIHGLYTINVKARSVST